MTSNNTSYFALLYHVADDYVARRQIFRESHLQLANAAAARRELILGGAFAEPVDQALLIFRATDKSVVEDFARNDPYVLNGLVTRWEVRKWSVVTGSAVS